MTASGAPSDDLLTGLDGHAIATSQLASVLDTLDGVESSNSVSSVEVTSDLLQPGSHSGVLRISTEGGGAPRSVFLKKITATHAPMAQRSWHDRRKTLAYARTESRFYQEFAPEVARRGVRMPKLGLSDNRLDSVLGDAAVHDAAGDEPGSEVQLAAGALLLLECAEGLVQASPLSEAQACEALRAVAGLHAAAWEDEPMLRRASERLQRHGGVYALGIRSPAEVAKIRPNWNAFAAEFRSSRRSSSSAPA